MKLKRKRKISTYVERVFSEDYKKKKKMDF